MSAAPVLLLALIAAVATIAAVMLARRAAASTAALAALRTKHAETTASVKTLEAERIRLEQAVSRLARYEGIAAADEEALRILTRAAQDADILRQEAEILRASATRDATALRGEARTDASKTIAAAKERADKLDNDARLALADGRRRAEEVLAAATRKAEEIAGDALKALEARRENEAAVEAMDNVIKGYGDRYLVPGRALLDELADGFGHTEAGSRLKETRERVRGMVLSGAAATCDYAEPHRRVTAIRFVVDAFNGKVDSILAMVKHDNAGTLQQQIKDSFALVNHNGAAFRNARITQAYLDARLEEVTWAATAQELRIQEREEQRRIKEQIREEEKARREFERAIREAEKEEDMLRKAMQKAEQQLAKASDVQRAKFEEQLALLSARLVEAETKSQRALSMAQQTRRGHVYIISNVGSFGEHVYKIGLTRRLEPIDRIRELGDSSVPFEFDVHALIFAEDAPALENRLHKHFVLGQLNKVNHRKEFFRVELADLRAQLEAMGLATQWTMTAAARDYRESLAIEAAIKDNPAARDAWIRRQLLLEIENPFEADEHMLSSRAGAPALPPMPDSSLMLSAPMAAPLRPQ
ncbi:MAG: DUF4041 domain-containing protein [Gemmatimonadota bacterium]